MKKNVRNALAISGLALAIGASGLTLTASANMMRSGNNVNFGEHQNPSKIMRTKKVAPTEMMRWRRRAISGIVSAVSTDSVTIQQGDQEFVANVSAQTRILDRTWSAINLSDIKQGDKIKVFGSLSANTITAKTIRDISLPNAATN